MHHMLQGKLLLSYYNEWCGTEKQCRRTVAWKDVCIAYDSTAGEAMNQVAGDERKHTYIGMPHNFKSFELTDPVFTTALKKLQRFIKRSFWANTAAWKCHQSALAIAKRGLNVDEVFFFIGAQEGGV